eukprot:CAMPEP_0178993066 /NCGR_PEP_ID=MMETSP0795-20121207/6485_1 /TAXON_ID=88552 /ORGANISM="Amoebophrya sp., Strain Ameob2" /LENGTH=368 /DNA_ID=CAMNT_0020685061 /DNA_START=109 /DNA_END=1215 /DNA_ORIENTATION=+
MRLIRVAAQAAGAVSAAEFEFPLHNGRNQFSTLIGVGTPAQYFPMLLDSGSEEVWVPGPNCQHCDDDGKVFLPQKSQSFGEISEPMGMPKVAGYASGEVWYHEVFENVTCPSGTQVHDHGKDGALSLLQDGTSATAPATTVRLPIGLTDRESPVFQSMPFDGIIGLAPSKSNFVEALYESGQLKHRKLGISLLPAVHKMFLGDMGAEKEKRTVWLDNDAHDGYWSIDSVFLSFQPKNGASRKFLPMTFRAILDSGSSVAMMTRNTQQLVKSLVPCTQQLTVHFGEHPGEEPQEQKRKMTNTFTHAIDVYVHTRRENTRGLVLGQDCGLDVMDLDGFSDDVVILGKDFFEEVETWFDWDGNKIGLVKGA